MRCHHRASHHRTITPWRRSRFSAFHAHGSSVRGSADGTMTANRKGKQDAHSRDADEAAAVRTAAKAASPRGILQARAHLACGVGRSRLSQAAQAVDSLTAGLDDREQQERKGRMKTKTIFEVARDLNLSAQDFRELVD